MGMLVLVVLLMRYECVVRTSDGKAKKQIDAVETFEDDMFCDEGWSNNR